MKLGLFLMPAVSPDTTPYDATQTVLEMIRYGDEIGYAEAWIGEHYTTRYEPIPSPDLVIAQALLQTKNIKLAPGAHLLPYHHPVELAHRIAYLDHLAQGRLMLGVAPGQLPGDWELFNVDWKSGEHREMTFEALEIMFKIWTEKEPFEYRGKYWDANRIEPMFGGLFEMHLYPYQKPYPPIGIAGTSPNSATLKLAGQYGFMPMSLGVTPDTIGYHWTTIQEGASIGGKTANRDDWRVAQHVFVADTDEEAIDLAVNGMMGEFNREYYIPLLTAAKMTYRVKHQEDVPDEAITPEYLAKHNWYVGSPETVAKKLDALYEAAGGFGTLLVTGYDYGENKDVWFKSMRLLQEEVLPRLKHNRKIQV